MATLNYWNSSSTTVSIDSGTNSGYYYTYRPANDPEIDTGEKKQMSRSFNSKILGRLIESERIIKRNMLLVTYYKSEAAADRHMLERYGISPYVFDPTSRGRSEIPRIGIYDCGLIIQILENFPHPMDRANIIKEALIALKEVKDAKVAIVIAAMSKEKMERKAKKENLSKKGHGYLLPYASIDGGEMIASGIDKEELFEIAVLAGAKSVRELDLKYDGFHLIAASAHKIK